MTGPQVVQSFDYPLYAISDVIVKPVAGEQTTRLGTPANTAALVSASQAPRIGQNWRPAVDHTSFAQDAVLDVLFFSAVQSNAQLPGFGTVLIGQSFGSLTTQPTLPPGTPFTSSEFLFAMPNDPALVGAEVSTQCLALDSVFAFHLTNAIDLVIGS